MTGFDFSFFLVALGESIKYTPVTLLIALLALVTGLVFGILLAVTRIYRMPVLSQATRVYVVLMKGIPMVVMLLLMFYAITKFFDDFAKSAGWGLRAKDIDLFWIAVLTLSLWSIANLSEVFRGALLSVGKGQYEAAYSVGLSKPQAFFRILLPQAIPVALPSLCNALIGLVKGSSIAFMVSVVDLLNAALISATGNYLYLEAYLAAALVYWVICASLERVSHVLEKNLTVFRKEVRL